MNWKQRREQQHHRDATMSPPPSSTAAANAATATANTTTAAATATTFTHPAPVVPLNKQVLNVKFVSFKQERDDYSSNRKGIICEF